MLKKILIILIYLSVFVLSIITLSLLFPLPEIKPYSLVVYDRNGSLLNAFRTSDGMWRIRTHPDEIPPRLKEILLFKEDRYFSWVKTQNKFYEFFYPVLSQSDALGKARGYYAFSFLYEP